MPSAEETTYLTGVVPQSTQTGFSTTCDVDLLVSQIKENLQLSNLKAKSSISNKNNRPSPYRVPPRSWADLSCEICGLRSNNQQQQKSAGQNCHHHHHHHHHHHKGGEKNRVEDDDPYEILRKLIEERKLIKEAVKRFQALNADELENYDVEKTETEVVEEDDERRRRKPYFYDSEDETLPETLPLHRFTDL